MGTAMTLITLYVAITANSLQMEVSANRWKAKCTSKILNNSSNLLYGSPHTRSYVGLKNRGHRTGLSFY
jgi:hypothetical protein